ncbi:MAG TPA: DUF2231 domain-containing protein [Tepidisphaeraceae bacterium]|jgi:uncharacterized membrane protein
MPHEFINPNWHVILIHYPLALLTLGMIVEIISVFSRKGGLRIAGRWMIGLGALLAIPTATSGLYAFRDVVTASPTEMRTWHEVTGASQWNTQQWEFMRRHIIANSIAVGVSLIVVFLWLSSGDTRRRKLYWFLLIALIASNAMAGIGAWHGGELSYRFGTGVVPINPNPETTQNRGVSYWADPLQVHALLAGLTVAAAVVAMALSFRKWEKPVVVGIGDVLTHEHTRASDPLTEDPARDREEHVRASLGPYGEEDATVRVPPKVYPGWFYFTTFLLAVATAFFGYWSVTRQNPFDGQTFRGNLELLKHQDHRRLLAHVIAGVLIILFPLLLGLIVRVMRGKGLALILMLVLLIATGLQVWFGIALLYDGYQGPLFKFNDAAVHTRDGDDRQHIQAATREAATKPLIQVDLDESSFRAATQKVSGATTSAADTIGDATVAAKDKIKGAGTSATRTTTSATTRATTRP